MIYVGTSGFSYQDWKGHFYPEDIKNSEMLEYYSRHFNIVEVNYTYYALPSVRTISSLVRKSDGRVRFSLKAHRDITHSGSIPEGIFNDYIKGIEPITERGLLDAILVQFPWSFKYKSESLDVLRKIKEGFGELPVAVEFRNSSWDSDETANLLRELDLAYCIVDEPDIKGLMPLRLWVTSDFAYFRFHGRNKEKWYNHREAWERYDYLYTREELEEMAYLIRKTHEKVPKVLVFMNNHPLGKAVENARDMVELLSEEIAR
ncbi:MAG: DUF72 domain-containing protein [Candidatus Coatesbacteria bacterium]|nr:MAG: DUF72 domain-containing protein [Candidatus Coatesbacteria bacterium]